MGLWQCFAHTKPSNLNIPIFFTSEQVSAFNASYSDSGLFGVYTISQVADAGDVSIPQSRQASVHQHKLFDKEAAVFFFPK